MNSAPEKSRQKDLIIFLVAIIAAAAAVILVVAGIWIYRNETRGIVDRQYATLSAVGALKASQIEQWRKERASDALRIAKGKFLQILLPGLADPKVAAELRQYLDSQTSPGGGSVLLFSPDGRILLSGQKNPHEASNMMHPALQREVTEALKNPGVFISELYRCPSGKFHVDFVAAVRDGAGTPLAVVVLRNEADDFLFPLIQSWPIPSETAESLLTTRDGEEVVFLNDLRHLPDAAMKLRFPMSETNLPSVQGFLGRTGLMESMDYRGVPVLSDVRPIKDSPWVLVAKIDRSEIFSGLDREVGTIAFFTLLLILLLVAMVALLFIRRQAWIWQKLQDSEDNFRSYVVGAPEGVFVIDEKGFIHDINPAAEAMSGYFRDELIGMPISELTYPEDLDLGEKNFEMLVREGQCQCELRHVLKDGRTRYWEIKAVRSSDHRYISFVSDVHDRHLAEDRARLTHRRTEALLQLPAARDTMDEAEFMRFGQELAEDLTGSEIAFIHFINEDEETIELVTWSRRTLEHYCHAAFDSHYPVGKAGIWADALRQRQPVVVNDYASHPDKQGLPEGHSPLQRLISVPVMENQRVVMLSGVGNKATPYDDWDVETVQLIGNSIWHLVQRHRGIAVIKSSEERLRSVIEASPVPFALNDSQGNISYLNSAFTKVFGYSGEDIPRLEDWWIKAYPDPTYQEKVKAEWAARAEMSRSAGEPFGALEVNIRCKDGSVRTALAMASRMEGDPGGTIVHLFDITARKDLENNLLEALDRAETANRAKGEFLAIMSHELRTPLNGVLGFAELLWDTELDAEQRDCVRTIQGSGNHLLRVVNDILDFSSFERKGIRLEQARVVLAKTVQDACAAVRKDAESKGLDFQFEIAPGVPEALAGDPMRIRQILINLLGNAVKFTSCGSVVLRVAPADGEEPHAIEFSVADTGIGMSAETLSILFHPFTQADSTLHRNFEGTGLGLAISQRLAEAMGGKISVFSTPGKGSIFTLRLPVCPYFASPSTQEAVAEMSPSGNEAASGQRPKARLLLVEDDRISALLARRMLSTLGFEVDLASDGQKALDAFVPGKYGTILMDMQMPVMDGIEATRAIRALEDKVKAQRVRIIALTANVMAGDRDRCLAAGMDDFLSKPFRRHELAAKVQ